ILASLFLFMPRRRVEMTVEILDRSQLPGLERGKLNPWLEAWYNAPGPEKPTYVSYHFLFGRRSFEFPKPSGLAEADLSKVKAETKAGVAEMLAEFLQRPLKDDENRPETTLAELDLDSLQAMEVALQVERRFGFAGDEVPTNVGQLWALAQGLVERK